MTDAPLPAGTIRLMTAVPVEIVEHEPALLAAARSQLNRVPWVVPAVALGAAATYLMLRPSRR